MKCPHCSVEIHEGFSSDSLNSGYVMGALNGRPTQFTVLHMVCPACKNAIVSLVMVSDKQKQEWLVYPMGTRRNPAAVEVPPELAEDFNEAGQVLGDSPKASAALSRRCLQALLRLQGFTQKDLAPAITAVLASKALPSWLSENLDVVRNIGNFAAHPLKDTNTGAILPVEPHEAEWNLEVLEGLFDFYFVQPAKDKARRDAFNIKLQAAGKPAIKS